MSPYQKSRCASICASVQDQHIVPPSVTPQQCVEAGRRLARHGLGLMGCCSDSYKNHTQQMSNLSHRSLERSASSMSTKSSRSTEEVQPKRVAELCQQRLIEPDNAVRLAEPPATWRTFSPSPWALTSEAARAAPICTNSYSLRSGPKHRGTFWPSAYPLAA